MRIWFVILTVFTVVFVVEAVRELVNPAVDGQPGTVTITYCGDKYGGTRRCYGDFTSTDGRLVLTNSHVFGEDYGTVGEKLAAYGDAADRTVTVDSGYEHFMDIYIAAAFILGWAGMGYVVVYQPLRHRRAARRAVS